VTDGAGRGSQEPVGSVGEEAAKLLHALQDWAKDTGSEPSDAAAAAATAAAGAAAGAATTWERLNEHLATGGTDCRYCPVCQVISAVRQTSPEVREHLAHAASSLMQAAAGVLATQVPDRSADRQEAPVQKINLDDDGKDD
jgi:hypothetical protein